MYHIQGFREKYLVVNTDTKKAIAAFDFLNDAVNLLSIIEDCEITIEYLSEGKE